MNHSPILAITAGFPGAGKSTFAKSFAHRADFTHLIGDQIRKEISKGNPSFSMEETQRMIVELNHQAITALKLNKSVICDVNFLFQTDRKKYYALAKAHGASALTFWFDCPLDIALSRNKTRSVESDAYYNNTPDEAVVGMFEKREPIALWEWAIKIDCSQSTLTQVKLALVQLQSIFE